MPESDRASEEFALLYTDGASSGNPGPAGIGAVLIFNNNKVTLSEYIGHTTNNVAEYTALLKALKLARDRGVKRLKIMLDSELVVKQLLGLYKVKNEKLKVLYNEVKELLEGFHEYEVRHIPRQQNREADALSRKGIRGAPSR